MSDTNIVVDLDMLDTNQQLSENQLIYREECKDFARQIREAANNNIKLVGEDRGAHKYIVYDEKQDNRSYMINSNPCFFVNGARGTGKSTFLKALTKKLTEDDKVNLPIALLASVDPTALGESESFFVHILSKIYEIMEDFSRCSLPSEINIKNQAADLIDKILNGLKLLSNPKKTAYDFMEEPSFFMEENLKQCINSAELKKLFGELIKVTCQMKRVSALLITVDDADMNFHKCSEIMETVRKYMIIPHLVFVFVGDLNLYSLIVRGMQFQNFGEYELKYDNPRIEHRESLMDQLEEQYLAKLFPAENRMNIYFFAAVMAKDVDITYQGIKDSFSDGVDKEGRMKLNVFLGKAFNMLTTSNLWGKYRELLGSLSSRSACQLMRYWARHAFVKAATDEQTHRGLTNGISMVASQELIKEQINASMLEGSALDVLIEAIVRHVNNLGVGLDGSNLLPNVGIHSQQMSSLYLSSVLVDRTRKVRNKLEYMFKLFVLLQALDNEKDSDYNDEEDANLINTLCENLLHMGQTSYTKWGAIATEQMIPKVRSGSSAKRFGCGTMRMMKKNGVKIEENQSEKKFCSLSSIIPEFAEQLATETGYRNQCLLGFYHSISIVYESNGSYSYCFSVFNLIATLLECLKIIDEKKGTGSDAELNELKEALRKQLEIKSDFPHGGSQFIEKMNEEEEEDNSENKEDSGEGEEDKVISAFKKALPDGEIDKIIDDIIAWEKTNNPGDSPVYSSQFEKSWRKMYSSWLWRTDDMILTAGSKSTVKAGELVFHYLNAVTQAIKDYWGDEGKGYSDFITSFPLWSVFVKKEAIETAPSQEEGSEGEAVVQESGRSLRDILNDLNIGQRKKADTTK